MCFGVRAAPRRCRPAPSEMTFCLAGSAPRAPRHPAGMTDSRQPPPRCRLRRWRRRPPAEEGRCPRSWKRQGKGRLSKDCSPPTPDEASETPSDSQRGREKQRSGRESKRIELNVEKQGAKARRRGRCAGRRAGGRREGGWVFVASLQRALCPEPPDPDGPLRGVNAPTAGLRKCRLWVSKSLGEDANEAQAGKRGVAGTRPASRTDEAPIAAASDRQEPAFVSPKTATQTESKHTYPVHLPDSEPLCHFPI